MEVYRSIIIDVGKPPYKVADTTVPECFAKATTLLAEQITSSSTSFYETGSPIKHQPGIIAHASDRISDFEVRLLSIKSSRTVRATHSEILDDKQLNLLSSLKYSLLNWVWRLRCGAKKITTSSACYIYAPLLRYILNYNYVILKAKYKKSTLLKKASGGQQVSEMKGTCH